MPVSLPTLGAFAPVLVDMWIDTYPLTMYADNGFGAYAVADSLSTYWGEDQYQGTLARGRWGGCAGYSVSAVRAAA